MREQISKINESDTILLIKPSQRSQFVDKFNDFAMSLNFKEISQKIGKAEPIDFKTLFEDSVEVFKKVWLILELLQSQRFCSSYQYYML